MSTCFKPWVRETRRASPDAQLGRYRCSLLFKVQRSKFNWRTLRISLNFEPGTLNLHLAVTKELLKESAEALFRRFSRTSLKRFRAIEIHRGIVNQAGDFERHDNPPLAVF